MFVRFKRLKRFVRFETFKRFVRFETFKRLKTFKRFKRFNKFKRFGMCKNVSNLFVLFKDFSVNVVISNHQKIKITSI